MKSAFGAFAVLIALANPGFAETGGKAGAPAQNPTAGSQASDRFQIIQSGDKILRVDRATGAVSICRQATDRWTCEMVPDDRAAMEAEMERTIALSEKFKARIDALETRLAELEKAERERSAIAKDSDRDTWSHRAEEEFDRMMDFSEKAMRRFFGMVRSLREDYEEWRT